VAAAQVLGDPVHQVDDLWARFDALGEEEFLARMDALAAQLPPAVAAYERASAFDSTGHEEQALPLYREALALGLEEDRRRQCVIQLASTLRNLGRAEESVALLEAERGRSDEYSDGVAAFLALALHDAGRKSEALSVALGALAGHMDRYRRSLTNYAREL
jgi:tetratricopeptide (TPR) repeat protein